MKPMRHLLLKLISAVLTLTLALPGWSQSDPPTFSKEQLDQLLAPIALYPDSLLTQVLMAATYPAQVAEAVQWSKAHPNDKGDAAVEKVAASTEWEPSVQSLVAFPEVINIMGQKPEWVQDLGDAFLAQPTETMDAVQRLRKLAQDAGQLKSNEQQKVVVQQPTPQQSVIVIEPAQPQVVYVPAYNPTVVYGVWPYPSYPPYYMPPPYGYYPGSALVSGMAFGVGLAITNSLWGGWNWGRNDVNINVNRYNNVNVNRKITNVNNNNFTHNSGGRKGVPYRDNKVNDKYGKSVAGKDARNDYRGRDKTVANSRDSQRDAARQTMEKRVDPQARDKLQKQAGERPGVGAAGKDRPGGAGAQDRMAAGKDRPAGGAGLGAGAAGKDRQPGGTGAAQRPAPAQRDNALKGAGNGSAQRADANRGQASRQAAARSTPAARPAPAARPSPAARPRPSAGGGGHRSGGGHRGR